MSRIVDTTRRGPAEVAPDAVAPASPRRAGSPDVGVVNYFQFHDRIAVERVVDGLEKLGATHLRTAISWADWHREGGPEWYDWLVPLLTKRFSVLPCFLYTPPHLGMLPKTSSPPRDPEDYGRFIAQTLERYRGRFDYVELWNEPNNYIEWDWTIDPEWTIFARMIASAAQAARHAGVKSVLGGMSPLDPNWLNLMFVRGAMECIDVVGIHGFPGTWEAVWEGWAEHVGRVQEVLDRHDSAARVWITEAGFSTWAHDEFRQLHTLVELMDAPVERAYWYSAEDLDPVRSTLDGFHCDERAYHFGLHRLDGTPKLAARIWGGRGLDGVRDMVSLTSSSAHVAGEVPASLVIGGAGFIGANLARALVERGKPVVILDNLARPGAEDNARVLGELDAAPVRLDVGDIRDPFAVRRALDGCDEVFHLAVAPEDEARPRDVRLEHAVNVTGVLNLLEEMRRLDDPPRLVFASGSAVYAPLRRDQLRKTDTRFQPLDEHVSARGIAEEWPLAFTALADCSIGASDQYVLSYAGEVELPATVLRLGCVCGHDISGSVADGWAARSLRSLSNGEIAQPKQVRDLLTVEDLVDALLVGMANHEALIGRPFNVGGGSNASFSALELADLLGLAEPSSPRSATPRGEALFFVSDTSAFRELTGWLPVRPVAEELETLYEELVGSSLRQLVD